MKRKYEGTFEERFFIARHVSAFNVKDRSLRDEERKWHKFNEENIPTPFERPVEDEALNAVTNAQLKNKVQSLIKSPRRLELLNRVYVREEGFSHIAKKWGTTRANVHEMHRETLKKLSEQLPKGLRHNLEK